ncbi:MAG: nucleotidyltransferase domain-containing protein [Candidatus Woesearchaeota archaeon]|nr:nucleotidyltransferase domain-containing protein [Candidatus Woesearchaeota archaeon]
MLLDKKRIAVIEEFTKKYDKKLTGSEIAKEKNLNQKTVANILKELEKEHLLYRTTKGRNAEYHLHLDNKESVQQFVTAVEHLRTLQFYKEKPHIKHIVKEVLEHCKGIVLIFGSYAKRSEKKTSDLDLFVAGRCDHEEIRKISEIYHLEIQIFEYRRKRFGKIIGTDILLHEIRNDHIILRGAEDFVRAVMHGHAHQKML